MKLALLLGLLLFISACSISEKRDFVATPQIDRRYVVPDEVIRMDLVVNSSTAEKTVIIPEFQYGITDNLSFTYPVKLGLRYQLYDNHGYQVGIYGSSLLFYSSSGFYASKKVSDHFLLFFENRFLATEVIVKMEQRINLFGLLFQATDPFAIKIASGSGQFVYKGSLFETIFGITATSTKTDLKIHEIGLSYAIDGHNEIELKGQIFEIYDDSASQAFLGYSYYF